MRHLRQVVAAACLVLLGCGARGGLAEPEAIGGDAAANDAMSTSDDGHTEDVVGDEDGDVSLDGADARCVESELPDVGYYRTCCKGTYCNGLCTESAWVDGGWVLACNCGPDAPGGCPAGAVCCPLTGSCVPPARCH